MNTAADQVGGDPAHVPVARLFALVRSGAVRDTTLFDTHKPEELVMECYDPDDLVVPVLRPPVADMLARLCEVQGRELKRLLEENARLLSQIPTTTTEGKAMTQGFTIQGRGIHEPTVSTEAFGDRVDLRLDDFLNPEFWLSLQIDTATLFDLLGQIISVRGHDTEKRHRLLDHLREMMEG